MEHEEIVVTVHELTSFTTSVGRTLASHRDTLEEAGLSAGTINRDLSALRRAFRLGLIAGKIPKVPAFPHLKESAPRSGFVEDTQFRTLADHAKEFWFRVLITIAYTFGFRKSELLNRRVSQISLTDRTIRLNAGETKSGDGRLVKLTQDVFLLLQALIAGKSANDFVFTREDGRRVGDFREMWATVCCASGLGKILCPKCSSEAECISLDAEGRCPQCSQRPKHPKYVEGLLFHDLRRSALRNMIRCGIPERVAMTISGHKTRAVFERYNIVSETDIAEAARKLEFGQSLGRADAKIVSEEVEEAPLSSKKNAIN